MEPGALRLQGKSTLVTGGGSGIGRAIATLFAREGASVVIGDIDPDKGRAVEREIREAGGEAAFICADVTRETEVASLVGGAVERYGPMCVLVNNAGSLFAGNAVTISAEQWQRCLDLDLRSAWLCCRAAIPKMRAGASIVNIASTHPFRSQPDYFPYAVAKGGLLALTVSMAVDFGPRGIRVNAICPGLIETPLAADVLSRLRATPELYEKVLAAHPLGKIGQPQDVAYAALFLATEESAFITGISLVVDGGRSVRAY